MEEKSEITTYVVTETFENKLKLKEFLSNLIISKLLDKKGILSDIYDNLMEEKNDRNYIKL